MPSYSVVELQGIDIRRGATDKHRVEGFFSSLGGVDIGFFHSVDDRHFEVLRRGLSAHSYVTSRDVTTNQAHDCLILSKFELKKQFATWLPKSNNQQKNNSMILASIMSDKERDTLLLNVHIDTANDHMSSQQVKIIDRLIEGYGLSFIVNLNVNAMGPCLESPNLSGAQVLKSIEGFSSTLFYSQTIEIQKRGAL